MTDSLARRVSLAFLLAFALAATHAAAEDDQSSALGFERTPPRLAFTDGEVSYWRPGDEDWTAARVNTPLAEGDELSTGAGANLELQIGARAFMRAGEATQLALGSLEPDYLKLEVLNGTAALDVRELGSGQTFEIDTPNAAFTIERPGYYRIEVADDATKFTTRRGGQAVVQTKGGLPSAVAANEQLEVRGTDEPVLASYGAPSLDDWDRWNYSRSERQNAPESARYVPAGVYGADDLDDHGSWRTVPAYGSVWVPRVAVGWAPYSAGRWIDDPYYGWTWIDDAPWGWAPFHHGRWVRVGGYWGWAPGPRVVRAYYSPALVAFYSSPSVSVSVSFGTPYLGWVALGWGEPVVPWWGPRGCRGAPRWTGWGGPHVVNNVVIHNHVHVDARHIKHHEHWGRHGAAVAVERGRFGRGSVKEARIARFDTAKLAPVHGRDLGVRADRKARVASEPRGTRPSREIRERRTVTRENIGAPRGQTRAKREAQIARGGNERRVRAAPAAPPTRMARAERSDRNERTERRAPAARPEPAKRERTRERAPAPPSSTRARSREATRERTETRERRSSVSEAQRGGSSRRRESSAAPSAPKPRAQAAPRARESNRERARPQVERREPRAQSPARVERRERTQAERREPRAERSQPRVERRERAPEPQRQPRQESPRGEKGGSSQGEDGRGNGGGWGSRRG